MEQWKTINGYENYEVSTAGNVRNKRTGRILKPAKNRGYLQVGLYNENGKHKTFYIHRLVAIAFIPNPDNLPEVNHINENKEDNSVDNLEWISHKNNMSHGTRGERQGKAFKKTLKEKKINYKKVYCVELDQEFDSITEAQEATGAWNINRCCQGKQETAGGYHWKYVKNN